jgi:NADH dehydrogenase (ubiquinone) Fe-S protein 3
LYAQTTESLHTYGSYLIQCLPKFIQQFSVLKDELTVYVAPSGLIPVLTFLRDHSQCQFKAAMDISGVDFPEREKRFEVVYHLLSIQHQGRIRVKTYAGEADHVPSACELFRGADWLVEVARVLLKRSRSRRRYEREAWDFYGIFFSNHPDLCVNLGMFMFSCFLTCVAGAEFLQTTV